MEKIFLFDVPTKMVMDPVHGAIHLFEYEVEIIDHPLFQRLKYILQNDVVFMVFPGCGHNRFLHSLGTMHLAGRYFRKLSVEYLKVSSIERLNSLQSESINYIYRCIRLAALLHDAGHSPFSHQFEHIEAVNKYYSDPKFIEDAFSQLDISKIFQEKLSTIKHEHFSVRSADTILKTINTPVKATDVLYFMEGANPEMSEELRLYGHTFIGIFYPGDWESNLDTTTFSAQKFIELFLKLLKQIISGEVDSDKMDYILRDSYYSGCNYGKYNLDHLLNNFRVGYDPIFSQGKLVNIMLSMAITEKGVGALEDFIYARFQLYQELYNHKSVSGFRKLLSMAISEIMASKEMGITKFLTDLNLFSQFTDTYFWEQFRKYSLKNPSSFCNRIINRKKLTYLGKLENMSEEEVKFNCQSKEAALEQKVYYWKSSIKFSSINEVYNDIKILTKDMNGRRSLKRITDVTDFFEKFKKEEIYHVFT